MNVETIHSDNEGGSNPATQENGARGELMPLDLTDEEEEVTGKEEEETGGVEGETDGVEGEMREVGKKWWKWRWGWTWRRGKFR